MFSRCALQNTLFISFLLNQENSKQATVLFLFLLNCRLNAQSSIKKIDHLAGYL